MTMRESILIALKAMIDEDPMFPEAVIDEPEPSRWTTLLPPIDDTIGLIHAVAVQDGPPPDILGHARGPEGGALDELELEAAIAYGVQAKPGAGTSIEAARVARRAQRDRAQRRVAQLIASNRTLGLGVEVWAEVGPAQRDDDVAFPNALPAATFVTPVRVLYSADNASD